LGIPQIVFTIRDRTVLDGSINSEFADEFTRAVAVAVIGARGVAAGVAGKAIVAGAFPRFTVAKTIGGTFRVVVGLVVAVGNVTPRTSKKADAFGAIQGLVTGVAHAQVVVAA